MSTQVKSTVRTKKRRAKALEKSLMRDFVSDVEELVKKVVDVPGVDLATVRDRVSGAIAGARDAVENGADSVRNGARAGTAAADEYVRGYPWAAVGIAIGLGVLLGFTSRR
jgi:ElaB/YqjD/DUF883 family membrane-anchored ribosome-binding protein